MPRSREGAAPAPQAKGLVFGSERYSRCRLSPTDDVYHKGRNGKKAECEENAYHPTGPLRSNQVKADSNRGHHERMILECPYFLRGESHPLLGILVQREPGLKGFDCQNSRMSQGAKRGVCAGARSALFFVRRA